MPLWDLYCEPCDRVQKDWFVGHAPEDDEIPICSCGQRMRRMVGNFSVVFTGPITQAKYMDPKLENYHAMERDGGYWQYRKRSSRDGNPEPVFIQTHADEVAFARDEHLIPPSQLGPMEVCSDGKTVSTRGLKGCW